MVFECPGVETMQGAEQTALGTNGQELPCCSRVANPLIAVQPAYREGGIVYAPRAPCAA